MSYKIPTAVECVKNADGKPGKVRFTDNDGKEVIYHPCVRLSAIKECPLADNDVKAFFSVK